MELRHLKYFTCLYEEGSVTRAAQRLNIVQPALSMQIARLEEELGQTLFERSAKGMAPTEAGDQALPTLKGREDLRDLPLITLASFQLRLTASSTAVL